MDIKTILQITVIALMTLLVIYIAVRLASIAWFKSKRDYQPKSMKENTHGEEK